MVTKVIVFVLCAGVAFGQSEPIYPRLDSLNAAVYAQLNVKATGTTRLTAGKLRYALNRAQAKVATDFPALEKSDTVLISRSVEGGTLNADFQRLFAVNKRRGDTLRYALKIIPVDSVPLLNPATPQKPMDVESPAHCWSWGRQLRMHPKIRGAVDTFYVDYYALPPRMNSLSDTCLIPSEYLELVVFYACGLLSATREGYDEANWYFQWYEAQKRPPISREAELKQ
jgi:hypothetical protein